MPLTPADIHHIEFTKAAIGRRGYDEEQVDTLLDEISQEMISLLEENNSLQRQTGPDPAGPDTDRADRTVAELSAVAAELDRAREARDRAEAHARDLRRELDQARADVARDETTRGGGRHAGGGGPVLAMAQRSADDHVREAHEEADAMLAEAQEKSRHLLGEAREAADDLEQDARRKQTEAIAGLQTRRAEMLREIGELTRFAEGYRAALGSHIARQGQYLDGTADELADES